MANRTRYRCLFLVAAMSLCAATLVRTAEAAGGRGACWTPSQLTARTGEQRIFKGIRKAYRPIPDEARERLPELPHQYRGVIRRVAVPPGMKVVALTFDLCEQPNEISGYQGDIVDTLRREAVPATFFASGKWLLTHPERAEQLVADPLFEMGNHAWEHRNFQVLETSRMAAEIVGAKLAFQRTATRVQLRQCQKPAAHDAPTSVRPLQRNFRFPFGACRKEAIHAVNREGLRVIQWDVSSADPWRGQTTQGLIRTVVERVRPGSIVLFHANGRGWKTGSALPKIIETLRSRGYRFVTVDKLLTLGRPVISAHCYDTKPGDSDRYANLGRRLDRAYDAYYAKVGGRRPQLPNN